MSGQNKKYESEQPLEYIRSVRSSMEKTQDDSSEKKNTTKKSSSKNFTPLGYIQGLRKEYGLEIEKREPVRFDPKKSATIAAGKGVNRFLNEVLSGGKKASTQPYGTNLDKVTTETDFINNYLNTEYKGPESNDNSRAQEIIKEFKTQSAAWEKNDPEGFKKAKSDEKSLYNQYADAVIKMEKKSSLLNSFSSGVWQAFDLPVNILYQFGDFLTQGVDSLNQPLREWREDWLKSNQAASEYHPIVTGIGQAGGEMAKYAATAGLAQAIPGVNSAYNALGKTGSSAISKIAPGSALASYATPEVMSRMVADTALDITLDTLPNAVIPGIESISKGEKTGTQVAGDVAKNLLWNATFNVGAEAVGDGLKAITGKIGDAKAAKQAIDAIKPLDGGDAAKSLEAPKTDFGLPVEAQKTIDSLTDSGKSTSADPFLKTLDDASRPKSVGAMASEFSNTQKVSKVSSNTYENTSLFTDAEKNIASLAGDKKLKYDVVTEKQSLKEAAQRLSVDYVGEMADLPKKAIFDGTDVDTAMMMMRQEFDAGNQESAAKIGKLLQERLTSSGQATQAMAKYTRTPEGAVVKAQSYVAEKAKRMLEANPELAKAIDDFSRNLNEITRAYQLEMPVDPDVALSRLRKAVNELVKSSKLDIDSGQIDEIVKAMMDGRIDRAEELLKAVEGIPFLTFDDTAEIMKIFADAEKYGVNSKARMKMEGQAFKIVADKFDSTFVEKLNTYRYMSMLFNPGTHLRNFSSNTVFGQVITGTKERINGLIQGIYDSSRRAIGKEGMERTSSLLNPLDEGTQELKKAAKADFDENFALYASDGKYNPSRGIKDQMTIFKNKSTPDSNILKKGIGKLNEGAEKLRNFNTNLLEGSDALTGGKIYADRLTRYLNANGADASIFKATDEASQALLSNARAYAILEAQKATFRDASSLANLLSQFGKDLSPGDSSTLNLAKKGVGAALEGVMPFKKTPINIAKRAWEYSPAGIVDSIITGISSVKKGKKAAAEVINKLSAGLTGSGIMVLGAYLFHNGIITVGRSAGKEGAHEDAQGIQGYALQIGDHSYSLGFLSPAAVPLFIGAEVMAVIDEGGGDFNDIATALARIGDPMLEMTMLQGLDDALAGASYNDSSAIQSVAGKALTNYATQFVPSILGTAARTIDDTRRSTYTDKTGLAGILDYTLNRVENRIPFLSTTNEPYIDVWGREQKNVGGNIAGRAAYNILSPGYYSNINTTTVDEELNRVYKGTGEAAVLPSVAAKSISIGGESRRFTPEEYTTFATERGQIAYKTLDSLFGMKGYDKLSDAQKQEVISNVYQFANVVGRNAAVDEYTIPNSLAGKTYEAYQKGIDPSIYLIYKALVDVDGNGSVTQKEAQAAIDGLPLPVSDKDTIWRLQNNSWKNNPYKKSDT